MTNNYQNPDGEQLSTNPFDDDDVIHEMEFEHRPTSPNMPMPNSPPPLPPPLPPGSQGQGQGRVDQGGDGLGSTPPVTRVVKFANSADVSNNGPMPNELPPLPPSATKMNKQSVNATAGTEGASASASASEASDNEMAAGSGNGGSTSPSPQRKRKKKKRRKKPKTNQTTNGNGSSTATTTATNSNPTNTTSKEYAQYNSITSNPTIKEDTPEDIHSLTSLSSFSFWKRGKNRSSSSTSSSLSSPLRPSNQNGNNKRRFMNPPRAGETIQEDDVGINNASAINTGQLNSAKGEGTTVPQLLLKIRVATIILSLGVFLFEWYALIFHVLLLRAEKIVLGCYLLFFVSILCFLEVVRGNPTLVKDSDGNAGLGSILPNINGINSTNVAEMADIVWQVVLEKEWARNLRYFLQDKFGILYSCVGRGLYLSLVGSLALGQDVLIIQILGWCFILMGLWMMTLRFRYPSLETAMVIDFGGDYIGIGGGNYIPGEDDYDDDGESAVTWSSVRSSLHSSAHGSARKTNVGETSRLLGNSNQ